MNYAAILHIPMSEYAFAVDENTLVFRLRTAKDDIKECTLFFGDRACRKTPVDYFYRPMKRVMGDDMFDFWEITLKTSIKRILYGFSIVDFSGERRLYYGARLNQEMTIDRSEYFQLPFNHRADRAVVPDWMKDACVYNIFPDSFATGKEYISGLPTEKTYKGEAVRGKLGGTIRGITENLEYIKDLGFSVIYMNPIFAAGEYHKYDLIDYYHIDPAFGTDEEFGILVRKAHAMNMRVMIDGVFNHCGWNFFAFKDAVKMGRVSRYWDWFYGLNEPVTVPDNMEDYPNYECFGYERMMPKLATDNPEVRDYFVNVGAYWVEKYDIDGWRLDVASEANDSFWRAFRKRVKAIKKDVCLIGEIWETASHWLDGSMFDGAMNYDFRRHARRFFALSDIDAREFESRVTDMLMRYRTQVAYAQLNLLDSHDVSRFLSLCGGDERKMKLAVLFQMTFPGMPSVFYGDERAMTGVLEEEYRHPMPWNEEKGNLFCFYKHVIHLRNEECALRRGTFSVIESEKGGGFFRYLRKYGENEIEIVINRSENKKKISSNGEILFSEGYESGILDAYGFYVYRRIKQE
ncbi:MAG: alpha-glycosidase [Clostridia bacterium]|nr:alpha-glycosidase [Clostridia bacterium]